MRLIDADELENYLHRLIKVTQERIKKQEKDHYWGTSTPARLDERREFLSLIENAPTVDAVPREEYEKVKADRDSWEEAWRESENEIND